jgi:hypothetical protein
MRNILYNIHTARVEPRLRSQLSTHLRVRVSIRLGTQHPVWGNVYYSVMARR